MTSGPVASSARPRTKSRSRARERARAERLAPTRRRRRLILGGIVLVGLLAWLIAPRFQHAVQELSLPLRHEDIIRQQAREKHLDPALVAGVIYVESKFVDQTSAAGARGLMQITPATAAFIARRSGGISFTESDLATPQVNISYGTYYLRYLIDRYGGNETLAVAAYNGGAGNVDKWLARAAASGEAFSADRIPFPETRAYVERVFRARNRYRKQYAHELGL